MKTDLKLKGLKFYQITSMAIIFVTASAAQAYVFSIQDSGIGAYVKGRYATWSNGQTSFSQSSGTNNSWNGEFDYIPSYEFGVISSSKRMSWYLGLEIMSLPEQQITGSNSSSKTAYYNLTADISSINPKIGFEINLKTWTKSRAWINLEGGEAIVDIQNSYNFTSAGSTKYGLANFREEVKGQSAFGAAGLGFETLFSDTTTFSIELGYRYMDFTSLAHNLAVTNFQGAVSQGSSATTNSGGARSLDMSGPFAGVGLRIWMY
jgi:hypothetical protein